ncbi:hypothetical protein [Mycoplasma sp. 'Moose RK']|uniref:hypothetical protein n=1 Tax=Mycoplasma sp. 'Moose RK' TaxID=2780095 RepID=UPI0018C317A3|nr:hypothetical protein [Mycoplasma sp. 'Moose RK']MBG0730523.1 hypothetical protein [Mycoplasma sp. 'Moose RK']
MENKKNPCVWTLISNTHLKKAESLEIVIRALFLNNEEINYDFKNKWLKLYKARNWKPIGDLGEHLKLASQLGITKTDVLISGKQKVNLLARLVNTNEIKISEYMSIILFNLVTFISFKFCHIFKKTLELLKKNNNSPVTVDQVFKNLELDSSTCKQFDQRLLRYHLKQKDHIFYILISGIFFEVISSRGKNNQFSTNFFQIKLFDHWFSEIDNLISRCNTDFKNFSFEKATEIRVNSDAWSSYLTKNSQSNYDYITEVIRKSKLFKEKKEEILEIETQKSEIDENFSPSPSPSNENYDFELENNLEKKINIQSSFTKKISFLPSSTQSKLDLTNEFSRNAIAKFNESWEIYFNQFSLNLCKLFSLNLENWLNQSAFKQNFFNLLSFQKNTHNLVRPADSFLKESQNLLLISDSLKQIQLKIRNEICKSEIDAGNYENVVFHDGFSENDFIGYNDFSLENRNSNTFVPGIFAKILSKAHWNPGQNFCLIIQNINNQNAFEVIKPFLPIFFRGKNRKSLLGISHPVLSSYIFSNDDQKIFLPPNLSIIGTIIGNLNHKSPKVLSYLAENWDINYLDSNFDNFLMNHPVVDTGLLWKDFIETINFALESENLSARLSPFFVEEKVLKDPKLFANKVVLLLWTFTFREKRSKFFKFETLDELIKNFVSNKNSDRLNIFNLDFFVQKRKN